MATTLQLTARELAIAEGRDPDAITEQETPPVAEEAPEVPQAPEEENEPETKDYIEEEDPDDVDESQYDWRNEVEDLATSYGMTKDELSQFGSQEEFERAGALIDSRFMKMAPQPPAPEPEQKPLIEADKFGTIDIAKLEGIVNAEEGEWDPETVEVAKSQLFLMNKFQEQERQQFEKQIQSEIEIFDQAVDTLGLDDVLGKSFNDKGNRVRLTEAQHEARGKLWGDVNQLRQNITANGGTANMDNAIVKRTARFSLSEHLSKKENAQKADDLRKQSSKRRPVGSSNGRRRVAAKDVDKHSPEYLAGDPELAKFFE